MATLRAVAASRNMSASTERCSFSEARSAAACRSDSRRNGAANEMACSPKVRSVVPMRLQRDLGEHLLGQPHQVLVVHVRLVELQHRELRVVLRRDPFVAEVAVDLVDAIHAADDEPLEVQLGGDAHVQLHVERVVMRDERPRQRAAGDRLHHRRLDFEEATRVEEAANGRQRARPDVEHAARVRVDDQIEVPLAIARLDVLQPVPLLGQRQEALGQERQGRRPRWSARWSASGTSAPRRPPGRRNRAA